MAQLDIPNYDPIYGKNGVNTGIRARTDPTSSRRTYRVTRKISGKRLAVYRDLTHSRETMPDEHNRYRHSES